MARVKQSQRNAGAPEMTDRPARAEHEGPRAAPGEPLSFSPQVFALGQRVVARRVAKIMMTHTALRITPAG